MRTAIIAAIPPTLVHIIINIPFWANNNNINTRSGLEETENIENSGIKGQ